MWTSTAGSATQRHQQHAISTLTPQARPGPPAHLSTNLAALAAWRQQPSGFVLPVDPSSSAGQGLRRISSAASSISSSGEAQPVAGGSGDVPLPAVHLQVRLQHRARGLLLLCAGDVLAMCYLLPCTQLSSSLPLRATDAC
jgi:hypothetical protein